jgi:hypothetical protein
VADEIMPSSCKEIFNKKSFWEKEKEKMHF